MFYVLNFLVFFYALKYFLYVWKQIRYWFVKILQKYIFCGQNIFGEGRRYCNNAYSEQGRPQDFSQKGARFFRNKTFSVIRNKEKGQKLKKKGTKLKKKEKTQEKRKKLRKKGTKLK